MIGGTDVILSNPARPPSQALDDVVRSIRSWWPQAIVQDAETGTRYETLTGTYHIPFGQFHEIFVYQDEAAFDSWEELGADRSNANSMVHIISGLLQLTVVVDDAEDPTMSSLLVEMRNLLESGTGFGWAA